jgi:CHAT domain-containing protein/tetratricopeptide (TPR) repeat protein
MIQVRLCQIRISILHVVTGLVISAGLGAATAWPQDPSPGPAPGSKLSQAEKARRLAERDRYQQEADRQAQAGNLEESINALGKELAIEREVLGELHEDVVGSLKYLAYLHELGEDWAAARKALAEVLAIRARQPNRKDWRLGDARRALADLDRRAAMTPAQRQRLQEANRLNWLQDGHYRHGKYAEGIGPCRKAMEIWGELLGKNHPDYALSLNNLAALYQDMGDYARAEPLYLEALAITKKAVGTDHPNYALYLNNLADLYRFMGPYARAEPLYRQALEIWKKALGADHPNYALYLNNLADLYLALGDYARAEPLLRQALEITKKALGTDHPHYARSFNSLAALCLAMGDYARAEPLLRQALEITKKALGADHPHYAFSLDYLAELYEHMGAYARAESLYRQALEIRKKALGADHPDYAGSLNSLAALYEDMGDYARAEPLCRQALAIRKKALGADHPNYAGSLNNLAALFRAMGDYARAEPLHRQALEIRKKALGTDHPDYAGSLNNLAALHWQLGDYARAEPLLREALAIRKKALGADHPGYAKSLNNLAVLYQEMSAYARAEPLFREALAIWKKARGADHPHYAAALTNLVVLYCAMNDYARAEPLIIEALETTSRFTRDASSVLGERQLLRLYQSQRGALDGCLSMSRGTGARPADLYRHVLDWKGAAEARRAEDRLARGQPELGPSLAQLAQARGQLANLAFRPPPAGQAETWRQQLDKLRAVKEDLEADLARRSAGYHRQKQVERLRPDEVAAALPAEMALVDFLEYTHYSPSKGGKGPLQEERRLLAFVLRRGRPVALVSLGEARTIDESVRSWRRALGARQGGALQTAAAELGRRVWEPLRPHLGDARTVLIAPDGFLSFFPFAALPGSRPGSYLIEDLALGYVASGRTAVEALADPSGPAGRGLLAVGDVNFQADPGQPGPSARPPSGVPLVAQRAGFRPLPGTGPEARRARELFHAAFADQPAELLTKAEPTEAALKRRLDGGHWRVVHLGTHGFFESPARVAALRAAVRREDPSALLLKADKPSEGDLDFALTLLRSGVVLAGGGRDPGAGLPDPAAEAPAREDGILTAEEVQALDLRGTELVVLSACETGLGELEYGQGVLGLQRAFQAAGARAVVASLWKVEDAATSVLMEQFYVNLWDQKLPRLEALRQAQLAVLKDPGLVERRRTELARGLGPTAGDLPDQGAIGPPPDRSGTRGDPAQWAAFVLGGDGR